jgi:hypothetical protein
MPWFPPFANSEGWGTLGCYGSTRSYGFTPNCQNKNE